MFSTRNIAWRAIIAVLALVVMYLGGLLIDQIGLDVWHDRTFFRLRFEWLADVPFWFVAGLTMMVANGLFLLRWGVIEGGVNTPGKKWYWPFGNSDYSLNVPLPMLKMVALNLLLLPAIWLIYIAIAAAVNW